MYFITLCLREWTPQRCYCNLTPAMEATLYTHSTRNVLVGIGLECEPTNSSCNKQHLLITRSIIQCPFPPPPSPTPPQEQSKVRQQGVI